MPLTHPGSEDELLAHVRRILPHFRRFMAAWIFLYIAFMLGVTALGASMALHLVFTPPFRFWALIGFVAGLIAGPLYAIPIVGLFRPDDFFVSRARASRLLLAYHEALPNLNLKPNDTDLLSQSRRWLSRRWRPRMFVMARRRMKLLLRYHAALQEPQASQ